MLRLYITETAPFLIKENYEAALKMADTGRRMQVLSMKQEKGRAQSLAVGLLLAYAVRECGSMSSEKTEGGRCPAVCKVETQRLLQLPCSGKGLEEASFCLEKTPAGKPYFKNRPGFYFNLSHSGEYAVCALSDREVGVDIQEWRKLSMDNMAKRIFDGKEMEIWQKHSGEAKKSYFYSVWTAKEACVKCTGAGLSKDFRQLRTDFTNGNVIDTKSGEKKRLYEYADLPGYALCLCEDD